ncbi:MAG: bifunctional proline dehydrogenase/L-glutamate gamma-semialdehyde dehydrogenase, partial [Kiritimatiellia bacterium]|nr:bifunctional proline dehydrogenase/L-glutamate gamma-semialdehyde dehydrogenase [Kiritimatiellia bacterium]
DAYFGGDAVAPAFLKWGLKGAGLTGAIGARLMNAGIRANIEEMSRQFIVGEDGREAAKRMGSLRGDGYAVVADLLGEATVTPAEEEAFEQACLDLVSGMDAARKRWSPLGGGTGSLDWGFSPKVQLSIKPSALCCTARPVDPEDSAAAIETRLARIYRRVLDADGELCIDMESLKYKGITLEAFRRLRARPEFRAYDRLGIVLQAYLRESERDLEALLDWSLREDLPIAIRLVKGAYWDYESVLAAQNGWPRPVWDRKPETDACYERMARRILEHAAHVRLGCASHNLRTIACVLETARALGTPESRWEFQVLYGMAEPIRRAVLKQTGRVRLYAPCGALIPGMAYLVRRLLENTANESFLRQKFAEGLDRERLLESPMETLARLPPLEPDPQPVFRNEPAPDFTRPEEMNAFRKALSSVRTQLGRDCPLLIGGAEVATAETDLSRNPARPSEVIGRIARAGTAEAAAAVQAATRAFPDWRDTPPLDRARILRTTAGELRRRLHEHAAWQILEVGKQWDQAHADVGEAIDFLEYYAAEMLRLSAGRSLLSPPGELNRLIYEPRGVALVISPWNFPLPFPAVCARPLWPWATRWSTSPPEFQPSQAA